MTGRNGLNPGHPDDLNDREAGYQYGETRDALYQ